MSEGTNKKQLSLRIIIAAVAFGTGFFAGRAHLRSEIANSFIEAASEFADGLDVARSEMEALEYPVVSEAPSATSLMDLAAEAANLPRDNNVEEQEASLLQHYCDGPAEKREHMIRSVVESGGPKVIDIDETVSSTITETTYQDYYGERWFFFICERQKRVIIEMSSDHLDPMLILGRGIENRLILANDDDSGIGLDAEIHIILSKGIHQIAALSNPTLLNNTGPYILSVKGR